MFNNGNAQNLIGGIIRQIGNGPIIIDIYTNGYELHNHSRNDRILNVNPNRSICRISRGNYFLCVLDNEIIRPIQPNAGDVVDILYVTNDVLNGIYPAGNVQESEGSIPDGKEMEKVCGIRIERVRF